MKQQHTPFDLPRATRLSLALCLGMALTGAHAQVSEATRAKVAELQKDTNFKLKGSARKCMSGELVDPDCDDLIANQILLYEGDDEYKSLIAEKARLDGEKARLDGEKARLDGEKARLDAEKTRLDGEKARLDQNLADLRQTGAIDSHVGGTIFLVETLGYAFLQLPETSLRNKKYLAVGLPANVTQYITGILAKLDAKRPITQDDLRELDALYQEHNQKAGQLLKENSQIGNSTSKNVREGFHTTQDLLLRTQINYAALRPRCDAAVRR